MHVRTDQERDRRKRLGLDQATLAARVGVSRQWIVEVERGKPRAEVGLVMRALRVLGVLLVVADGAESTTDEINLNGLIDLDMVLDRARRPLK